MTFKFIMNFMGLVSLAVLLAVAADVLWLRPLRERDTWSRKHTEQLSSKRRR